MTVPASRSSVAAAALLAERRRDIPRDFLAELFGYAAPEDLARYRAEELAAIAEQSWSLLAQRKSGAPNIRFEPAALTPSVAVLEIVNDDMPFLVNSVLGELNERGLDVRLLVHPVFTVERDAAGNLLAFKGTRKADGGRESFIHIHIEGMADAAQRAEIVRALEEVLADVRICVQDWRPMLARVARDHRRIARQSAAACRRRDRRSDPVPRMDGGETISRCSACATTPSATARMRSSRNSRPASGCCARARCGSCAAARSW